MKLDVSYDDSADVLYITSGKIVPTKNMEDEEGLVLRYDIKTHRPVGATIVDFKGYWLKRKDLAQRLAEFFGVSATVAQKTIKSL